MIYNFENKVYEKAGDILTSLFVKTKITPNQITIARALTLVPLSAYLFSKNEHFLNIVAVLSLYFDVVLDAVDGKLARLTGRTSAIGGWLDEFEDKITQVLILMGITWGVFVTSGNDFRWLFIGLSLILGINIQSFIGGEFREKYRLYYNTLPKFWQLFEGKKISKTDSFLKDYLAPKSFFFTIISTISYLIVLGAVFNIMNWILLVMAFAANIRWMVMVYIYVRAVLEDKRPSLLVANIRKLQTLE